MLEPRNRYCDWLNVVLYIIENSNWIYYDVISTYCFCTPYVILSVLPRLRRIDKNMAEAALDLGCTPWQSDVKVIIPQIKGGIIAGALVAFPMSFDDFIYIHVYNRVVSISLSMYM